MTQNFVARDGGLFLYVCVVHRLGRVVGSVSTSFDEDMSLTKLVNVLKKMSIPLTRLFERNSCRSWDMGMV
jgi:hypothetical protein